MSLDLLPAEELPATLRAELDSVGLPVAVVHRAVVEALAEDVPTEDVTTEATVPAQSRAEAELVARAAGVVAGLPVAETVLRCVAGHDVQVHSHVRDGGRVEPGQVLMSVQGATRALLTAERSALNFACHLSGIATTTRTWVDAIAGTDARVRDTRKTIPGHRLLAKYAVRCGGGVNHRTSLSDQALVKDNHVLAAGGVVAAYRAVRRRFPDLPVQVEVTTLTELRDLLDEGASEILLDNMTVAEVSEAVRLTAGRARLEASGGLRLAGARAMAATGVDYLAVGALTHSAPALDIALDLRAPAGEAR